MKKLFKPEDFQDGDYMARISSEVTKIANNKIAKIMKDWPVIYLSKSPDQNLWLGYEQPSKVDTHKGYLAFIEPIEKEVCNHEPSLQMIQAGVSISVDRYHSTCLKCGVQLVAEWKEKC